MSGNTRKLTLAALLGALQLVLLLLSAVLPSGRLAFAALAGVLGAGILLECGLKHTILAYIAVSLLGLLLLPQKGMAALFALFFGYYPMVKSGAERLDRRWKEWLVKLGVFNLAFAAAYALLRLGFLSGVELPGLWLGFLWLGANAVFVLFDLGFTALIAFYLQRVHRLK